MIRIAVLAFVAVSALAQPPYELVLKGGHVLDSRNHINGLMDVGVADGRIAAVAKTIPADQAKRVVNTTGLYVTLGLVDIHAHLFAGTKTGDAA